MDRKHIAFEQHVNTLRGHSIARVRYFEIDYDSGEPSWNYSSTLFDSLDFGLELEMEAGELFSVTWNNHFYYYGIDVWQHQLMGPDAQYKMWDVTHESRWSSLLHKPIHEVIVYWAWNEDMQKQKTYVPQDMELRFVSGKRLWLSAATYMKDRDALFPMCDEVTVIFDDDVAQRYQIGQFRDYLGLFKTAWEGSLNDFEQLPGETWQEKIRNSLGISGTD